MIGPAAIATTDGLLQRGRELLAENEPAQAQAAFDAALAEDPTSQEAVQGRAAAAAGVELVLRSAAHRSLGYTFSAQPAPQPQQQQPGTTALLRETWIGNRGGSGVQRVGVSDLGADAGGGLQGTGNPGGAEGSGGQSPFDLSRSVNTSLPPGTQRGVGARCCCCCCWCCCCWCCCC